jgi:hypothetical protein
VNKLETQALLKRAHLKADTYFTSLLQEAYRVNLLSEPELNRIQAEALSLLARQVDAFTGGRSSSVKVETAANIWESVFYTIGFYLKSFSDLNLALKIIKENSLLQLYKRGRKLVEIQFYKAKQLFTTIQGNCPVINNYAYNATIEKGIPLFFATYDLNFAAHETPGSIDYPVSNDQMELVGIEYISGYLKKLFWENRFCQKFSKGPASSVPNLTPSSACWATWNWLYCSKGCPRRSWILAFALPKGGRNGSTGSPLSSKA